MPAKKDSPSTVNTSSVSGKVINLPTMPNSVEAEQNILFCIMRNPAMQLEIFKAS